jgi:hypothetical protein
VTCPDCGHRNPEGAQFCASCQAFLEWEEPRTGGDERPAPALLEPPAQRQPPSPATAPPPEPAAAAPRRPGEAPATVDDGPDHRPEEPPGPVPPDGPPAAPSGPPRPCPHCGVRNPADRTLCQRCGTPLAPPSRTPGVPATGGRLPWWRRVLGRRDEGRPLPAGSRPEVRARTRRRVSRPLVWLLVIAVVATAAWFGRDQLAGVFSFAEDQASDPEPLPPDQVGASSEAPRHTAGAAFDGFSNRFWAPAEPGAGTGEHLDARFDEPVHLQRLIITPGSSPNQDEFLDQARPAAVTLTLTSADGERIRESFTLQDESEPQTFELSDADVTEARLTIDAGYGEGDERLMALAEVEFFGQR